MSAPFTDLQPDWLDVSEAIRRVLRSASPLDPIGIPVSDAMGHILVEPVTAAATLPPFDNSAMDGYAARAADIRHATPNSPVVLRVTGAAAAGTETTASVESGEAMRIMTGAPLPSGADSVVRVEDTDRESRAGRVRILNARDAGRNVRPAGRDFLRGDLLLEAGSRLTPSALALAIAGGAGSLTVRPFPVVAILPTGDELVGPADYDRVSDGRAIPDTNGPMIEAAVRAAGGHPRRLDPVQDDLDALVEAIGGRMDADILVTIGGASMGTGDLVKPALDRHGFELDFWRVKMRPGSPFGFGTIPRDGRRPLPVLSLPGNPASAFVTFEIFVRPLVAALAGRSGRFRPSVTARTTEELPSDPRLALFPRVRLDRAESGDLSVRPAGAQSSGLVSGLAAADGVAVVPPSTGGCGPGSLVRVMLLDDAPPGTSAPEFLAPVREDS